jgi:dipicolinate synthase subunit A
VRKFTILSRIKENSMKKIKISLLGGDKRFVFAARLFSGAGYDTHLFANDLHAESTDGIVTDDDIDSSLENSDVVILPLPYSRDGTNLFAPLSSHTVSLDELFKKLPKNAHVLAGMTDNIPDGITKIDYNLDEEFTLRNAAASAEGALATLIKETDKTLAEQKTVIIGFGRIGSILADMLYSLGAKVSVVARNPIARARLETKGISAYDIPDLRDLLGECDSVINTVPYPLISESTLTLANDDLTIIDLASAPGGCDKRAIEKRGLKLIPAPGLPGKFAPMSAARALFIFAHKYIKENISI